MGNKHPNQAPRYTRTVEYEWTNLIRTQLHENSYLYLIFELKDGVTFNSGLKEITKRKLLYLIKKIMEEEKLQFITNILQSDNPRKYHIQISVINISMAQTIMPVVELPEFPNYNQTYL